MVRRFHPKKGATLAVQTLKKRAGRIPMIFTPLSRSGFVFFLNKLLRRWGSIQWLQSTHTMSVWNLSWIHMHVHLGYRSTFWTLGGISIAIQACQPDHRRRSWGWWWRILTMNPLVSLSPSIHSLSGLVYGTIYRKTSYFMEKNNGFRLRFPWNPSNHPMILVLLRIILVGPFWYFLHRSSIFSLAKHQGPKVTWGINHHGFLNTLGSSKVNHNVYSVYICLY